MRSALNCHCYNKAVPSPFPAVGVGEPSITIAMNNAISSGPSASSVAMLLVAGPPHPWLSGSHAFETLFETALDGLFAGMFLA